MIEPLPLAIAARAALLTAASRTAQGQSVAAIQLSLRLLRARAYPADRFVPAPCPSDPPAARVIAGAPGTIR